MRFIRTASRLKLVGALVICALVVLSATTLWSIVEVNQSTSRVAAADATLGDYEALQRAVSAEAVSGIGAPGQRVLSASSLTRAQDAVLSVLRGIERRSGRSDYEAAQRIASLNTAFVAAISAITVGPPPQGPGPRTVAPGPPAASAELQSQIGSAIHSHQDAAKSAIADQRALVTKLEWALPGMLALGLASLALGWGMFWREHRRVANLAADRKFRATHDVLTGLANRSLLYDFLDRLLSAPGGTATLLLIDLDRFKGINDTFGHAAGDQTLVTAARCLERVTRDTDLVARLGGDEFAVVLSETDEADAVITKIHDEFRAARPLLTLPPLAALSDTVGPIIEASIGVSVIRHGLMTREEVLAAADRDMYLRKVERRSHRDNSVHTPA